ncbi:MAG: hypothetical protein QGF90_04005 [Gammaproteobacteria bacterium]|nr:hypothetical protein [Gammaproteobacteria bacterium]
MSGRTQWVVTYSPWQLMPSAVAGTQTLHGDKTLLNLRRTGKQHFSRYY